jgi:hypothetical protein
VRASPVCVGWDARFDELENLVSELKQKEKNDGHE